MEMPSSCNDCLFGHWSNLYQAVFCELLNFKDYPADYTGYKAKRLDKCPLVDVPTPHGRLVDFIDVAVTYDEDTGTEGINSGEALSAYLKMWIAPPVIEAEGET